MWDPRGKKKQQDESEPKEQAKETPKDAPTKGGFGAFADKYRDRWEAEHPNAGKNRPAPGASQPNTPNAPAGPEKPPAKP